ncbi:hypothetical protein ABPS01_01110 [Streptococcus sp. ZJ151]
MLKKDTLKTKETRQSFKLMDIVKLIALLIPVFQLLRQMKKGRK